MLKMKLHGNGHGPQTYHQCLASTVIENKLTIAQHKFCGGNVFVQQLLEATNFLIK